MNVKKVNSVPNMMEYFKVNAKFQKSSISVVCVIIWKFWEYKIEMLLSVEFCISVLYML